jgi:hypothetical protein
MASTTPPSDRGALRRLLCMVGYHRPQRTERVAGADELELVVCETCGHRHMRHRPTPPADDWGARR